MLNDNAVSENNVDYRKMYLMLENVFHVHLLFDTFVTITVIRKYFPKLSKSQYCITCVKIGFEQYYKKMDVI